MTICVAILLHRLKESVCVYRCIVHLYTCVSVQPQLHLTTMVGHTCCRCISVTLRFSNGDMNQCTAVVDGTHSPNLKMQML